MIARRAFFLMLDSLYVGLQCIGRGYEQLNPAQTLKIIGIIQKIMRIIVFVQLKMLTLLHKASVHVHPEP